jgi:hypothetical protein
MHHTDDP